jgi:uncharacterized protein YvpB
MKKQAFVRVFLILYIIIFTAFGISFFADSFFVLISPPKVIAFSQNIPSDGLLVINLNKPVKRQEIELIIFPNIHGQIEFKEPILGKHFFKTLVFKPAIDFKSGTMYQASLRNIKGFGSDLSGHFNFTFISLEKSENKTQETLNKEKENEDRVTLINIPIDWQDDPLSCEAASLKMALNHKGIMVSENQIMEQIGYDKGKRQGNIWADAYKIYVGDISGKMCETGYGVYWEPVAKAAKKFISAEAFSNWEINDAIKEIKAGNPIVVWGSLPVERLTDCSWFTPEGKYIKAFKQTHVRLLVGFIGPTNNPVKVIINDPLSGRLYWSIDYFLENWNVFDNSGVVIR